MAETDVIVGLEVHCQLDTKSKLFCGCSTDYRSDGPNTHVCPICLGLAAASSAVLPPDPGNTIVAALSRDAPPPLRPAAAPPSPVLRIAAQPRAPPALA